MKKAIKVGAFTLELQVRDGQFLGIGGVRCGATALRSPKLPWTFYTESDKGVRFEQFRAPKVKKVGKGVCLEFVSEGRWLPRIQDADAMGDARFKTRRVEAPKATFRWTFRPVAEKVWDNAWEGLAMQLSVSSPDVPLHWMLEDTTWEIGGTAEGATIIQQDVTTIDLEQKVARKSAFSTIEKFFTGGSDAWGGSYPMDMLPRAAGAAICDFQAKGNAALCLFAERPGLTRARLEKFANENVIHYSDRPFVALSEKTTFPERKLLVYRQSKALKKHEVRNLWLDCFTEVRRRIHKEYGFSLEVPTPTVSAHLWDADLKSYGTAWSDPLRAALPTYAKLGYKQVFTHGVWDSVTSDDREWLEGNICCPYQFKFAEKFGGAAAMKRLVDAADALGLKMYQWFGMQFAKYSSVWKEHPDWKLLEANGDPWDGAYQILNCGRMASGFGKFLEDQVLQVRKDTGLPGIFWDSYQNLGVTCVDWQGKDKAPQAELIWKMQGRLQKAGYVQRCEVVTIFGVSQVGMYGFENDKFRRRLWADTVRNDEAFVLLDCSPCYFTDGSPFVKGKIEPEQYFWLSGHRAIPGTGARPWGAPHDPEHAGPELPGGDMAEEYAKVNHIYNEVLPKMQRLRVTEGGKYTLWLDERGKPSVIWAFADATIPVQGALQNVGDGAKVESAKGRASVKKGCVYRVLP